MLPIAHEMLPPFFAAPNLTSSIPLRREVWPVCQLSAGISMQIIASPVKKKRKTTQSRTQRRDFLSLLLIHYFCNIVPFYTYVTDSVAEQKGYKQQLLLGGLLSPCWLSSTLEEAICRPSARGPSTLFLFYLNCQEEVKFAIWWSEPYGDLLREAGETLKIHLWSPHPTSHTPTFRHHPTTFIADAKGWSNELLLDVKIMFFD